MISKRFEREMLFRTQTITLLKVLFKSVFVTKLSSKIPYTRTISYTAEKLSTLLLLVASLDKTKLLEKSGKKKERNSGTLVLI